MSGLVCASRTGGIAEMQAFVDSFARRHIVSGIERIKPSQIDQTSERIKSKGVRYRFVIDLTHLAMRGCRLDSERQSSRGHHETRTRSGDYCCRHRVECSCRRQHRSSP
ncbi:hypothetical protein PUN4_280301 [Paraburkholderia unamae]|nr:hypothetical protein PUN4_280301 [Paraburkholderia unamae]